MCLFLLPSPSFLKCREICFKFVLRRHCVIINCLIKMESHGRNILSNDTSANTLTCYFTSAKQQKTEYQSFVRDMNTFFVNITMNYVTNKVIHQLRHNDRIMESINWIMKNTEINYKAEKRSKHPETFKKIYFWTEKLPKRPETPSQYMYKVVQIWPGLICM